MKSTYRQGETITCKGTCGRTLPATHEFFGFNGFYADGTRRLKTRCYACQRAVDAEHHRNYRAKMKLAPEVAEQRRRAERERGRRRRKDPDAAERMREATRRSHRKVRQDQARVKSDRERQRIAHRMREEQKGRSMAEIKAKPGALRSGRQDARWAAFSPLPSRPLAQAIYAEDARYRDARGEYMGDMNATAISLGLSARNVLAWLVGERPVVQFDIVDRTLTNSPWLWFEVYNEATVRHHVLTAEVRRLGIRQSGARRRYFTAERHPYGDLGPDLDQLAEIAHAFECVGLPECATCLERRTEFYRRKHERRSAARDEAQAQVAA